MPSLTPSWLRRPDVETYSAEQLERVCADAIALRPSHVRGRRWTLLTAVPVAALLAAARLEAVPASAPTVAVGVWFVLLVAPFIYSDFRTSYAGDAADLARVELLARKLASYDDGTSAERLQAYRVQAAEVSGVVLPGSEADIAERRKVRTIAGAAAAVLGLLFAYGTVLIGWMRLANRDWAAVERIADANTSTWAASRDVLLASGQWPLTVLAAVICVAGAAVFVTNATAALRSPAR